MVALVYSPVQAPLNSGTTATTSTPNSFQGFMQQLASWSGGGQYGSQLHSWLGQMPNQSAGQTLDQYRQSVMDWRHSMPQIGGGSATQPAAGSSAGYQQQQGTGFNAPPSATNQQFYQSHGFYPGG